MEIKELIIHLMPDIDEDPYTLRLQDFFCKIASITDSSFIGNEIKNNSSLIISNGILKEIFDSYKGKTTKSGYEVKVFIASTYLLEPLNVDSPSLEWQWVSKLCHL